MSSREVNLEKLKFLTNLQAVLKKREAHIEMNDIIVEDTAKFYILCNGNLMEIDQSRLTADIVQRKIDELDIENELNR